MLSAFRRRLPALARGVVSVQALVLALGTAQVCADGEHRHGGVVVADCAMHHQPAPAGHGHHAGHGHDPAVEPPADGPRLVCRCSDESPEGYFGQLALLEARIQSSPPAAVRHVALPADAPPSGHRISPPSPPPR